MLQGDDQALLEQDSGCHYYVRHQEIATGRKYSELVRLNRSRRRRAIESHPSSKDITTSSVK